MTTPEPTPITCQPTCETICSCTHCGRQNYTTVEQPFRAIPNDVALFEVRVPRGTTGAHQTAVSSFCADCLQALAVAIYPYRRGV